MEGSVEKLRCDARVHGWLVDRQFVRIRCHDRRCPDVIRAKKNGEIAVHVWNVNEPDVVWTEYLDEGGQ